MNKFQHQLVITMLFAAIAALSFEMRNPIGIWINSGFAVYWAYKSGVTRGKEEGYDE